MRSNLTIILANKKYHDLPEFFKKHNVHVVSSMPYWTQVEKLTNNVVMVFLTNPLKLLHELNAVGYGRKGTELKLDLVYNPSGAFSAGRSKSFRRDFKKALKTDFDIDFHNLFAITNIAYKSIFRLFDCFENYEEYMESLVEAFNPSAVEM